MLQKKFIVIHSGSRDFYQVALALQETNQLKYFVTDDYVLRKNRPPELKKFVKTSYLALLLFLVHKVFPHGKINNLKDRVLSRFAYRVVKNDTTVSVVCYSYYSTYIFKYFAGRKILFQLHPHPLSVRKIFENEIQLNPVSSTSLNKEHELLLKPEELNKLAKEPHNADGIIVASTFTKKTLIENGILPDRIKLVSYGVDTIKFKEKTIQKRKPDHLNVLFVGSWNQRKGLSYLAAAVKDLQLKKLNIHLTIIGRGIMDKNLVAQYGLRNVDFLINLPLPELIQNYHNADVFVFPSLCEGFGHVILEAMACGLPVITTENTAGTDIITEGINGFIVPVNNAQIISQRLEFIYNNPTENIRMGMNAAARAKEFTWQKFRDGIVSAVQVNENT